MSFANKVLDRIVDVLMWIACACGGLMMVHITVDAFCRNILNSPLPGTIEIVSAYYMVAIAFFPLAYITRGEGQIFVELFTLRMPRRPLAVLDTAVNLATAIYLLVFVWAAAVIAVEKMKIGEVWESANGFMSVWPSRWILPVGLGIMAIYTFKQAYARWKAVTEADAAGGDV